MRQADAHSLLASRGWLSSTDPALASAVLQAGRLVELRKSVGLYYPGDEPGGMYGVVRGGILLSLIGRDGLPVGGHIMRPGSWFGYASVFDMQRRGLMSLANEPSLVLHVPLVEMHRIREALPAAHAGFGRLTILGEFLYLAIVSDLLIANTDHRLAAVLLRVTGAATPERPDDLPIDPLLDLWASPKGVPLTQAMLAELANTSPHTVARFVERVVQAGWVDWTYRRVCILDVAALRDFAAGKRPAKAPP